MTEKKAAAVARVQLDAFEVEPETKVGKTETKAPGERSEPSAAEASKARELAEAQQMPIGVREVMQFGVAHFPKLPLATTLQCKVVGFGFWITTSKESYALALAEGVTVLVGGELLALAHAAQNDRVHVAGFLDVLVRKQKRPQWRVTPTQAFGGMPLGNAAPLRWTFEEFFKHVGAWLVDVEVHR